MKVVHETVGIVDKGCVRLPSEVHLPEGTTVRVVWRDVSAGTTHPYDRSPLTHEDVAADLAWALREEPEA